MKYGYIATNFSYCGDARTLVDLAREAEDAGWDGFFTWDHIQFPRQEPTADPWVAFGAIAMQTERIQIGPMITPLPRRHLGKLAREVLTVDHLSNGRLILGIGAGAPELPEYTAFGDSGDKKVRAAMLDEGLPVLRQLLSGEPIEHNGEHYQVTCDAFQAPKQDRIPIWLAATWPFKKPFRRAARWDGVYPMHKDTMKGHIFSSEEVRDLVAYVNEHRTHDGPFDVCMFGVTGGAKDTAMVQAYAEAGVTWWHDSSVPWMADLDDVRRRIKQGPPRISPTPHWKGSRMSLSCPACTGTLIPVKTTGHYGTALVLETCTDCNGFWADVHEPQRLAAKAALSLEGRHSLGQVRTDPHGAGRECPRCGLAMTELSGAPLPDGLHVDSCGSCDGMWFDPGELLLMKAQHEAQRQKQLNKHREAIARTDAVDDRSKMMSERERKQLAADSYNAVMRQFS